MRDQVRPVVVEVVEVIVLALSVSGLLYALITAGAGRYPVEEPEMFAPALTIEKPLQSPPPISAEENR